MKRSILYKILFVPLLSAVFLLLVAGVGLWSLRTVQSTLDDLSDHDMQVQSLSKELRYPLAAQSNDLRGFVMTHTASYIDEAQGRLTVFADNLAKIKAKANDPREQEIITKLESGFAALQTTSKQTIDALKAGDDARGVSLLMNDMRDRRKTLESLSQDLDKLEETRVQEGRAAAAKTENLATAAVIASCVVSLLITWTLGFVTAQRISRPLRGLSAAARDAANGDLGISLPAAKSSDEVGELTSAFNAMVGALRELIRKVVDSSASIAAAARELDENTDQVAQAAQSVSRAMDQVARGATSQSSSAQEASRLGDELRTAVATIAAGAHEQAAEAERTVTVVNQTVESIRDVAARADNVLGSSQKALASAQNGGRIMERTLGAMGQIRTTVLQSGEHIRKLGEASSRIEEITSVITGIAEQTNLLALNAAIEAARAGENGRGFAVVAEEVRKLAERSSHSAGEISALIGEVLAGTSQAVANMESGVASVREGSELAQQAGTALSDIVGLVEQTAKDVASITSSTREMAAASEQMLRAVNAVAHTTQDNIVATEAMGKSTGGVNSSVQDIAAISEENAAAAEEVSASTEEMTASSESIAASASHLKEVAEALQLVVARFKV